MEVVEELIKGIQNIQLSNIIDILIAIIIAIIFKLLSSGISYTIVKLFHMKEKDRKKIKQNGLYGPIKNLIILLGVYLAVLILKPEGELLKWINKGFKIAIIIIIGNGFANLMNPDSRIFRAINHKINPKNKVNNSGLNFICKLLKVIIYTIVIFIIINEMGYDLSGIIAGLGLGSVVIALGMQDVAKNLFGGVAILTDRPFNVGDYISTAQAEGTVEDITFRSTKIRTVQDSVITMPNSILSNEAVTNFSKMRKRFYTTNLLLDIHSSEENIDRVVEKLEFMLKNREDIIENTSRVDCTEIKENGINITVAMYTNIVPFAEFLKFKTRINREMVKILESEGIRLSYPGQSVYIKNGE